MLIITPQINITQARLYHFVSRDINHGIHGIHGRRELQIK
jgi:hypothetical protein